MTAQLVLAAVAISSTTGLAQPPSSAPIRFDVASVKVSSAGFLVFEPQRSGGRINWRSDLSHFLSYAFNLPGWRINGDVPNAVNIFDVEATTDPRATEDQVRLMFQSLLADRFHLQAHRITKETGGYAILAGKTAKLQEAREGELPPLPEWGHMFGAPADLEGKALAAIQKPGVGVLIGRRVTLQQICDALQRVLHAPVLDQTGLTGKYYFAFQFALDQHPDDVTLPDLLGAVGDLGLKAEKRKSSVEFLIIDRIEKTPTEN